MLCYTWLGQSCCSYTTARLFLFENTCILIMPAKKRKSNRIAAKVAAPAKKPRQTKQKDNDLEQTVKTLSDNVLIMSQQLRDLSDTVSVMQKSTPLTPTTPGGSGTLPLPIDDTINSNRQNNTLQDGGNNVSNGRKKGVCLGDLPTMHVLPVEIIAKIRESCCFINCC